MWSIIIRSLIEGPNVLLPRSSKGRNRFFKPIPTLNDCVEPSSLLQKVGTAIRLESATYFVPLLLFQRLD